MCFCEKCGVVGLWVFEFVWFLRVEYGGMYGEVLVVVFGVCFLFLEFLFGCGFGEVFEYFYR